MVNLILLVRKIVQDISKPINDFYTFEYDTVQGRTWEISEENVIPSTIKVYKNNVLSPESDYTYNEESNRLTVNEGVLTIGDKVRFSFSAYKQYSDDEIEAYIENAFAILSLKGYEHFYNNGGSISPTPSLAEIRLIALVASILIKGNMVKYKTKEFEVVFNNREKTLDQKIDELVFNCQRSIGVFAWVEKGYKL